MPVARASIRNDRDLDRSCTFHGFMMGYSKRGVQGNGALNMSGNGSAYEGSLTSGYLA